MLEKIQVIKNLYTHLPVRLTCLCSLSLQPFQEEALPHSWACLH